MKTPVKHTHRFNTAIGRLAVLCAGGALIGSAYAGPYSFSTGDPDGKIATASRPSSTGKFEIESADDFILDQTTRIDRASFVGLLPSGLALSSIAQVRIEIYRVFPKDSVNPPSGHVLTRANSPSDVAFTDRDSALAQLSFTAAVLNSAFTVSNSVTAGGIRLFPNQTTGGNGPQSGEEVSFQVTFNNPFILTGDHYFFIPQILLNGGGDFLWLSAPKPIVAPGDPFAMDLQSWTRDAMLDPDWSRIGTDIVGAGAFNGVFSLAGQIIPEPATLTLLGAGLSGIGWSRRRARR